MSQPTTRVLTLLEMLQAREVTGGAELARALEVDRRTLRRYIVMLEELGIPIITTQGRYGGYQVVPGFKLPPMIFSDEEALALAVGLMAARGLGLAQSMPALATARAKLERVFPAKLKSRLRAVDESVALEFSRPATVIDQQVLGLLCAATQERHRVRMAYQSQKDEQTEREFDPYGLVYRAGRWYIVGCRSWASCSIRSARSPIAPPAVRAPLSTVSRYEQATSKICRKPSSLRAFRPA